MEKTGIKQQVIHEIQNLAQKYEVRKVILFGSRARGDFREKSDIDLAVKGGDFTRFSIDVNEDTSTLLKFDIINLDEKIQEELIESIQKEGRVLYEKFEHFKSNLRVLALAEKENLSNEFIIGGIIDKFFIQFELGWKVLKELLSYEGQSISASGSPK